MIRRFLNRLFRKPRRHLLCNKSYYKLLRRLDVKNEFGDIEWLEPGTVVSFHHRIRPENAKVIYVGNRHYNVISIRDWYFSKFQPKV